MKSYGQIIYEAYAREFQLVPAGVVVGRWRSLSDDEMRKWDRIGQAVADELNGS